MVRPKFKSIRNTFLVVHICSLICFQIAGAATIEARKPNVCNTEDCKNIASAILHKMNPTVNPCDNFYDFVCGNFTKNSVISPTQPANHIFARLRDLVNENLRNDIENLNTNKGPKAFQKMTTYYKTCMDESQIERTSNNEFLGILNDLGGWPVLLGKSFDDSKFDWKHVMTKINKMGYSGSYFFNVYIQNDLKNNTRIRINIDGPSFDVSGVYLDEGLENDIVKAYLKFIIDMAEILGANRDEAKVELEDTMKFELELLKIYSTDSGLSDEGRYNLMKISELQSKYPIVPWLDYINDWLSRTVVVSKDEVVVVNVPTYLKSLADLLDRTPKRVLANYALRRVAVESAPQLNQKVRDANLEFTAAINGNRNKIPRWFSCVSSVADNLYVATSSLYVRRNFDKSTRVGVSDMVKRIRQSFRNTISKADWMDETTRKTALNKLDKMLPMVGYPDEVLDDKKIDDFYKNLELVPTSFLKTVLSCKLFQKEMNLLVFRKPAPRLDWTDSLSVSNSVDSLYTPSENIIQKNPASSIVFFAPTGFLGAMLQGELYNKNFPKYVNYGAIGLFIGHEMTHGFDSYGRKFDAIGNYFNWWNADTAKKFLQKAKCFVDQYSKYTVSPINLKVSGDQTENENIADNGGLKQAYLAYDAFEKENGVEPILPGFERFTPRQLFWISNANVWCTKYRDEWLRDAIYADEHAPNPFRAIGTVSNSLYFAKDFNCPTGSPMNPKNKCSVW